MSADAWRKCPNCLRNLERQIEKLEEELRKSYGKVSVDEYERMKLGIPSEELKEDSFREDYETYMDEYGTFYFKYSGRCVTCNWKHEEKIKKQVLL